MAAESSALCLSSAESPIETGAVSYTHLDVYKRQGLDGPLGHLGGLLIAHVGAQGGDDAHAVLHHVPAPLPVGGDAGDAVVHKGMRCV